MELKILIFVFFLFVLSSSKDVKNMKVNMNGELDTSILEENSTLSDEEFQKHFDEIEKQELEEKKQSQKQPRNDKKENINSPKETKIKKKNNPIKKKQPPKIQESKKVIKIPKKKKKETPNIDPKKPKNKPKIELMTPELEEKKKDKEHSKEELKYQKIHDFITKPTENSIMNSINFIEDLEKLSKEEIIIKFNELKKKAIMLEAKLQVQQEMLNTQNAHGVLQGGGIGAPDHNPSLYDDGMSDIGQEPTFKDKEITEEEFNEDPFKEIHDIQEKK